MAKFLAAICLVLAAALNMGCSTLADAQAAKGSGSFRVYDKPYAAVWDAVLETVKSSRLALVAENKQNGSILAQGSMSPFSYGENVAIFVEDAGGRTRTRVEVVNKRVLAPNITAADWEFRIFQALDKRLQ